MTHKPSYEELEKRIKELEKEALMRKPAQDEADVQRETLARLFEIAPYIMMLVDKDGRVTNINHKGVAFLSKPKDALLGRLCGEVFSCVNSFDVMGCGRNAPCLDCPVRTKIMYTLETGQGIYDAEGRLTVRKGSTDVAVDVLISTALLKDRDADKVLVTINDITERKRAEEKMLRANEDWERTFDAVPELIAILDKDYRIVRVNKAMAARLGVNPAECIGLKCYHAIHGTSEPPLFCPHRQLIGDGIEHTTEVHEERLGGDFLVTVSPFFDPGSGLIGSVHICRDITERKRAENALLESEKKFKSFAEQALVGIYLSQDGVFKYVNPKFAQMFGYTVEECLNDMHFKNLVYTEDFSSVAELARMRASGELEFFRHSFRGLKKNGQIFHVEVYASTGNYNGRPAAIGTILDITERKQMEEALQKSRDNLELKVHERTVELKTYMRKLEESNRALQDFAFIASHDLQEPLRKVTAFGNMLKQDCGSALNDQQRDYLERMLNANRRMQSLLTGLLDYSRVATSSEPFKQVDLSDLIGEVISDLEVRIVKTGGEVHVEDLPVISADPTQMRQLFQNLIGNALKFHKEGEKPVISVKKAATVDEYIQIVVKDNGIGFEEKYVDKIFTPFQRLHGKSSPYEGTGMGLAICRKIVERHGGSITAKSAPGAGSTFIITLRENQNT